MDPEQLTARAESFKLLAECYYAPGAELEALTDDLMRALVPVCPETAPCVEKMREEIAKEPDSTLVRVDHARLFVGPFGVLAPPYGSVYLDGERRVMGSSTVHVQAAYREAGLDISNDCHEAPDHIAVELEFMHFLAFKQAKAAAGEDSEGARLHAQKQKDFLDLHLGAWVSEFVDMVKAHAETDFYKSLAECTRIFVMNELKSLAERPETESA